MFDKKQKSTSKKEDKDQDHEVQDVLDAEVAAKAAAEKESKIVRCRCLKQQISPGINADKSCCYCGGLVG